MRFSYVLPDPSSYREWTEFEGDVACVKQAGYDAVELQITDPAQFDEARVRAVLERTGLPMCAFQTGGSYATRGNCLSTADTAVHTRTLALLRSFVDLAGRWKAVIVFGSLQGRLSDEPRRDVAEARIREALGEVGAYATDRRVILAFEPVNHLEVGFHNTVAAGAELVRGLNLPGVRLMVDTFHMNIEECDMLAPLAGVADILAHVHLCETNRGVLGTGHWDTGGFLSELRRLGFAGYCSVGVYNTRRSRRDCITACRQALP
jgi:sugar phosphate isomerase/epimerase